MEPEIDRRCPQCGAAVRARAAFCPQCGRPMKASVDNSAALPSQPADPPPTRAEALETQRRRRTDFEAHNTTGRTANSSTDHSRRVDSTQLPPPSVPAPPPPPTLAGEANTSVRAEREAAASLPSRVAREQMSARPGAEPSASDEGSRRRGQRMAAAARDVVEERLGPRVEKLRQASTVVLDEAADDPNLRFLLIAVLLFIIALVLILLSMYLR